MTTPPPGPNGILLLDKPQGPTSHTLVATTRRALGTRKVGHAGTLDPMASGLMILGVGGATRLLTYFVGDDKEYFATVRLGVSTNTEDAEGELTATAPGGAVAAVTPERIEAAMAALRGPISQIPSSVSAIKVDGVRAYKRVRDGEEVKLAARAVTISELELLASRSGLAGETPVLDLDVRVACSSGTYIRALARDLGDALGTGAHLTALRRSRVGDFSISDAVAPDAQDLELRLLSPAAAALRRFPALEATGQQAADLRNGKKLRAADGTGDGLLAAIDPEGSLIGIARASAGVLKTEFNMPTGTGS
ncbi:tRNA pseudouridine(55) synthase TruB [Pseudoclavibacter sp. Z016]|uniref:tRNA pseudouridine(55) synthase TruB n=1 Tax=Pseudoclavibacter sp. Z016 TaxID=2080581 RepID=UPI000CE8F31F|nr:tRNA pseudouridine(55) synthase TruB [Pseudoclavibacter sp. Z016]PPF76058.1 tRNA pseudouridine(55) synthase TruB [Pseudoclavibacter sp. Z016]